MYDPEQIRVCASTQALDFWQCLLAKLLTHQRFAKVQAD